MSSSICMLGKPQKLTYPNNKEVFLNDPFSCSMLDFIQYCLNELTEVLHITVVFTYKNLIEKKQKKNFFLTGFGERKRRGSLQKKLYGDPSKVKEGTDLRMLLKNIRWNYKKYALHTNIYEDTFCDITGFFLFDILPCLYATKPFEYDDKMVFDCFDAAVELVSAISESKYYTEVSKDVLNYKINLEALLSTAMEYKSINRSKSSCEVLNTKAVLDFLQSQNLKVMLKEEQKISSESPLEKPLTNYFLNVVMARFDSNQFASDSGIVEDISLSYTMQSPSFNVSKVVSISYKDELPANETDKLLVKGASESLSNETAEFSSNESVELLSKETAELSANETAELLANETAELLDQTIDGSMIIINHAESTPVVKNKTIQNIKLKNDSSVKKPLRSQKRYSNGNEKSLEAMDGSFVLL